MARQKVVARPTGRPIIPSEVEETPGHVLVRSDGEVRSAIELTFSEEQVGRMRAGYICARCYEDLDTAFPDECPVCRFPMAKKQAELFAERFQGTKWVGPTTTLEEEREIMQDLRLQEAMRKKIVRPKPTIIVPRSW